MEVASMSGENVAGAGLDHTAIAAGIGELKEGNGYSRVLVGGKNVAYLKRASLAVPARLVVKAPKRLGSFKVEANGRWANAPADTVAKARAILEYVVARAAQS
jgi:hypothetical protein